MILALFFKEKILYQTSEKTECKNLSISNFSYTMMGLLRLKFRNVKSIDIKFSYFFYFKRVKIIFFNSF